jgi:RNA methyltransferase, TrmH family
MSRAHTQFMITSPANARVKEVVALRRRRVREQTGLTMVEGYEELVLALSAGVRPRSLFFCPPLAGDRARGMLDRLAGLGTEVIGVTPQVFGKMAYRESPDGWLAVVPAVATALPRLDPAALPLVLVCEGIEKPGNLGAILRTADAAGVAAVIAAGPVTDWGNPNVVRASKGTLFCVPVGSASSAEVLRWLDSQGLKLVVAMPGADLLVTEADLTGRAAIAVGSEKHGLPTPWAEAASVRVRIPMFGRADSLNVAAAAAIITYEAVRQRTHTP